MPTVTALRATRSGRVAVHLDGEYVASVSSALLARHRLFAGRQLDAAEVAAIHDEVARERALADAHRLLAHRPRAQRELADRLAGKGHHQAVIPDVVARLSAEGILDDHAFATAYVADKRRLSGWGDERIRRELARLGVEPQVAAAALGPPQADDELARAQAALRRHGPPRPPLEASRRRAYQFLQRRGFNGAVAYEAVNRWALSLPPLERPLPPPDG